MWYDRQVDLKDTWPDQEITDCVEHWWWKEPCTCTSHCILNRLWVSGCMYIGMQAHVFRSQRVHCLLLNSGFFTQEQLEAQTLVVFFNIINLLKPTGYVTHHQFNIQEFYALPTLYLWSVFIWEQTATCATYSINWSVFITEMKSVYSAVRTGSLNIAVCASSLKS